MTKIQRKFPSLAVLGLQGKSLSLTLHLQGSMHQATLVESEVCESNISVRALCGGMKLHATTAFSSTWDPVQKASEDSKLQGSAPSFHSNIAVKIFHAPSCTGLMSSETCLMKILGCGWFVQRTVLTAHLYIVSYMWTRSTALLTSSPSTAGVFFLQTSIYMFLMTLFGLTMSKNLLTIMHLKLLHNLFKLYHLLHVNYHLYDLNLIFWLFRLFLRFDTLRDSKDNFIFMTCGIFQSHCKLHSNYNCD